MPSGAGALVDPLRPGPQPRVAAAERLVLDEDPVEELVVAGRQSEDGVLEEREGDAVGDAELVVEVGAAGEQRLETVERGMHAARRAG